MYLGYLVLIVGSIVLELTPVDSVAQEYMNLVLLNPYRAKRDEIFKKQLQARLTKSNYVMGRSTGHEPSTVLLPFNRKRDYLETFNRAGVPSLIFDYANTVQNDIILFDHTISMQEKRSPEPSLEDSQMHPVGSHNKPTEHFCGSCDLESKMEYLGSDHYPNQVINKTCNMTRGACPAPLRCRPKTHEMLILKKRGANDPILRVPKLPEDLSNYIFVSKSIVIACHCTLPE